MDGIIAHGMWMHSLGGVEGYHHPLIWVLQVISTLVVQVLVVLHTTTCTVDMHVFSISGR